MKKNILLCITFWLCVHMSWGQSIASSNTGYRKVKSASLVQDKNFYLLTLFQKIPEVKELLASDKNLTKLKDTKLQAIRKAVETCSRDRACVVDSFVWSESEIAEASKSLEKLLENNGAMASLISQHIRPSMAYQLYDSLSDAELLKKAWEVCAEGMNHSIKVYGNGDKAIYPNIDSVVYDVNSRSYIYTIHTWASDILVQAEKSSLFFGGSLDFTNSLLYLNHKDEAARYEPMEGLGNQAAVDYIPSVSWGEYPYASILVLGAGSEIYGVSLTPLGKFNLRVAARQFKEGKAPLIIVSGGHVHPYRTPSCEAIEMKKELMEKYGIAEKHIIIEPHARHTTTNVRNASRLLFKYGVPTDKPNLVTTNFRHSDYVSSQNFYDRNMKELGYMPCKLLERISPTTIEWLPSIDSFQQNPLEPLDP
ncbi:YdcF family protein [Flammeovirgaceae bacterium SG7u.111]|nr:YdcF family protein [Flammeovirgaceae bacterium SG7u.132]WPO34420.1 YdcF family protein [Flammeovirgaceae bacterium SG7u.111]